MWMIICFARVSSDNSYLKIIKINILNINQIINCIYYMLFKYKSRGLLIKIDKICNDGFF